MCYFIFDIPVRAPAFNHVLACPLQTSTDKQDQCDMDKQDQGLVALLWCSTYREYKSKLCSAKFIRRHVFLRESAYQQYGGPSTML